MLDATLMSHVDTRKITREELGTIPAPLPTATHQPVPHIRIVEAISETLELRKLGIVRDEYAVSKDGMKMFGIMEVAESFHGGDFPGGEERPFRFAIGLRNANDKTMRLGLTAGYRVVVCDNMAFSGDFEPVFHKHTKRLELAQVISIGIDRIQRNFLPLRRQIDLWRQFPVTDEDAKLAIYDAFRSPALRLPIRFLHTVHGNYFEPKETEFEDRTYWSLSNAFTSMVKELPPLKQFQVTAKIGLFLNQRSSQLIESQNETPEQRNDIAAFRSRIDEVEIIEKPFTENEFDGTVAEYEEIMEEYEQRAAA